MINVFVCAEGGCYGNFLSTLTRILKDPNYIEYTVICNRGGADMSGSAGSVVDYLMNKNIYPYKEKESQQIVDEIVKTLKSESYYDQILDYDKEHSHVNVLHYINPMTIIKLLTVKNLKIIYVIMEESDCRLIAINKVLKNFDPDFWQRRNQQAKDSTAIINQIKDFKNLFDYFGADKKYYDEFDLILNQGSAANMSNELTNTLIDCWQKLMLLRLENTRLVSLFNKNENLLILKFKEILGDKQNLIDKLSSFLGLEPNDAVSSYYDQFRSAQQYVLDYQEKNK